MAELTVLFPGQGSQEVGMLADIAAVEPMIRETFSEASQVLGYDLWELVQQGPEDKLNQTEFTQPALLCASIALYRLWRQKGGRQPDVVAGHSLGEYSALVAAEVLEFGDAISLVQKRGQFMQSAVPLGVGSMGAILGLEDQQVIDICAQVHGEQVIQAVNFNAPGQVVIAGHVQALEKAIELCKTAGARRAMPLSVSAPFHCDLMKPAADNMAPQLEATRFSKPVTNVIQNVNAHSESDPDRIRENLIEQIYHPVLWSETVRQIAASGVEMAIECGPGSVLTGLNRRIDRSLSTMTIATSEQLATALDAVQDL